MNIKLNIFLSLTLVVFFLSVFMLKNTAQGNTQSNVLSLQIENEQKYLNPYLVGNQPPPELSAQAYLVIDSNNGSFLLDKNSHLKLYPASTVKMITALVAMDYYDNEDLLTVTGVDVEGQKMKLIEGEEISVGSLLYGLLVYSANDAAEVLADNYEGGRDNFIVAMNNKAREIGLNETNFSNPTGLDNNEQYTSTYDLIKIAQYALKNPFFSEVVSTKKAYVKSADGKTVHNLQNLNKLLDSVDGVYGVKTGWTEFAKENLVTYVERNGNRVMIALMGSDDRFSDTQKIIEWIYANYIWK